MNENKAVAVAPSALEYSSMEYASAGADATNSASEVSVGAVGGAPDNDGSATILNPDPYSTITAGYETNPSVVDSSSLGSSQVADYSMSVNGNVVSEAGDYLSAENGAASRDAGLASGAAPEHHVEDGSVLPMSPEEERLWSIVKTNSLDFNAWTSLIEETEKVSEDNILKIRKVYDAFLAEFPLCYGYWKKYGDHEARFGSIDKVMEVYERAVLGVTYSVDIWLHYCTFAINTYGDPETIRRLFERGLAYVGTDYLSYSLWDKYIEYEYSQQEWSRLAMIYTSILENPNQQLDRYFNSFKELASSRPLSELKSSDEAAASLEAAGQMTEGEIRPDAEGQPFNPPSAGLTEAQELEKYIAIREEIFKKAKEFDSKIIGFETAIRRPYFHVRPLNVTELENWHNYLDFMEREGDFNKVVKLYERCLIACASYPEYWIRYVKCMEVSGSMDIANNALARATQVFVKRQPEIHLFSAQFKEQNGDILGARGAYQLVHTEISPGLLEAIIKHANMERRMGKLEEAFSLYEQAIAIEKGKEHSQTLPMLFAQYSRFVHLVSGNAEKAREILVEALENVQLSKPLLEALIHLESIQSLPKRIGYLDSLVEKFISPNAESSNEVSGADREEVSCIYLEFVDLFGDAQMVKRAEDRHVKLFVRNRSGSESRKRHAEDLLASDRSKLAKSYPGAVQSVMGTYPATQNQWAAGYGVQPQAWPQVPVQGQQWNAGYTQQAAYGTYTGYGSTYTTPQVPASVPQSAAYSTYPTSYTGQATVAPQSYAQPAAVAAAAVPLAPAPQAASVPQAYYGTYY